jgi:putative ABC transport system permease protein
MTRHGLPVWPERILRRVLPDDARGRSVLGDLREEYVYDPAGMRRRAGYACACLGLAAQFFFRRLSRGSQTARQPSDLLNGLPTEIARSARALLRTPAYLLPSLLTLALGTMAAVAIFTIVYGALLRPLPFPKPQTLVRFGDSAVTAPDVCCSSVSVPNFLDLRRRTPSFGGLAAHSLQRSILSNERVSERAMGAAVTANFFDVLGIVPALGRSFDPRDEDPGGSPVVILGELAWQRHFARSPAVLGQTIRIDLVPYTVVGIVPAEVFVPGAPTFWVPYRWDATSLTARKRRQIEPIGRLYSGVTISHARAELRSAFADLARDYPAENRGWTMAAVGVDEWLAAAGGGQSRALLPLMAAGTLFLVLAAVLNVTNLTLGRVEHLRGDIAIRRALGAGHARLLLHRLIDSGLVAVPAALAGGGVAAWVIPLALARYGEAIPRSTTIGFDGSSLAATVVSAALTMGTLVLASSPRGLGSSVDLRYDHRAASAGRPHVRRWLVTIQIALASTLLYGALLVGGTLWSLSRVSLGVPLDHAQTFSVSLPASRYPDRAEVTTFVDTFTTKLLALPDVEAVGATSRAPFMGGTNGPVGSADDPTRVVPVAEWRTVTPGLFQALGLRLLEGRIFMTGDPLRERATLVVSDTLARALFPGQSAVGRQVVVDDRASYHVIGVVGDIRDFGPSRDVRATVYARHGSGPGSLAPAAMTFVVRQHASALDGVSLARQRLREIDPDLPLDNVLSLEQLASRSAGTARQTASTLLTLFTLVAVALAAVGIYGVIAFNVERRTRELGIRLALGDTPVGVRWRVLREGAGLCALGGLVGTLAMAWTDPLLEAFVVSSARPSVAGVLASILVLLGVISGVACLLPARRAARVSVVDALRAD